MTYPTNTLFAVCIALLALLAGACQRLVAPPAKSANLEKLLVDVFDPQPSEQVLVMMDLPTAGIPDNPAWADRRVLATEWWAACQQLAAQRGFALYPLLSYPATGEHSAPLPEYGEMDGKSVRLEDILANTSLALALTEYSATGPLAQFTVQYPNLRAASMPGIARDMQQTALAADYSLVAARVHTLVARLDRAEGATIQFSTGQQLYLDLRYRSARSDDGRLPADRAGERLINLPGGEAYIAPYEGERAGDPSRTSGTLPIPWNGTVVTVPVKENRVQAVEGNTPAATSLQAWFEADPARRNLAELGLGANDRAVITGNTLEDEKVVGAHLAVGRSDHIGGTVGPGDFLDPATIVHWDIVYARSAPVEISSLVLEYEDGSREEILHAGAYTLFHTDPSKTVWALLAGVAVAAGLLVWYLARKWAASRAHKSSSGEIA